jgi:hypothetical protein
MPLFAQLCQKCPSDAMGSSNGKFGLLRVTITKQLQYGYSVAEADLLSICGTLCGISNDHKATVPICGAI